MDKYITLSETVTIDNATAEKQQCFLPEDKSKQGPSNIEENKNLPVIYKSESKEKYSNAY